MKKQQEEVWARLLVKWEPPSPNPLQAPDLRDGHSLTDPVDIFHHLIDYRNLNLNPSKLSLDIAAAIR